jgi:hypothetical protein
MRVAQRRRVAPRLALELLLGVEGGRERVDRGSEDGRDPVAHRGHDHAVMAVDRTVQDRVVAPEGITHRRLGLLLPQARRSHEIGEEKRHRSGGQFRPSPSRTSAARGRSRAGRSIARPRGAPRQGRDSQR